MDSNSKVYFLKLLEAAIDYYFLEKEESLAKTQLEEQQLKVLNAYANKTDSMIEHSDKKYFQFKVGDKPYFIKFNENKKFNDVSIYKDSKFCKIHFKKNIESYYEEILIHENHLDTKAEDYYLKLFHAAINTYLIEEEENEMRKSLKNQQLKVLNEYSERK